MQASQATSRTVKPRANENTEARSVGPVFPVRKKIIGHHLPTFRVAAQGQRFDLAIPFRRACLVNAGGGYRLLFFLWGRTQACNPPPRNGPGYPRTFRSSGTEYILCLP